MTRPPLRVVLAVGLVAGTTLALQVLVTRLLSAVLYYHFGFLSISVALVGGGAGALAVYLRQEQIDRRPLEGLLARLAAVLALALAVAPLLLVRLDYAFPGRITAGFVLTLALTCVITAIPFTVAGTVLAMAIRGYREDVGRVYAFDLLGASVGAVSVVPLLWVVDGPTLAVGLGLAAGVAALLFAGPRSRERLWGALGVGTAAVLVVLSATTSLAHLPIQDRPPGVSPVSERWTPLSRVVGYPPPKHSRFGAVFYDRVYAPVPIRRPGTPAPDWRTLSLGPQSAGYEMTGPGRALIIGGGGGRDIWNALTSGQRRVDVIELNRAIRDTIDDDLREWSGAPYSEKRVHTVIGDGRSTLAARDTRYDQIHIGFTDTLSANSATAFALTESNLYTKEAFELYLDHLRPKGVLNVSRLRRLVGDEALRVTVLVLETLRERGVAHPERNVVVLLGTDIFNEEFGTVLTRNEPWTAPELAKLRRLASERGKGLAYAPGGPYRLEWAQLAAASSPQAFCEGYRFDVCAPTDDKPFFFNMRRLADLGDATPPGYVYSVDPMLVLALTAAILLALAGLGIALPLLVARGASRPPVSELTLFAAIGLGFLVLEVVLIQRFVLFLGFPTYALSIVLFALLAFTGIGARLTERVVDERAGLGRALAIACGLIAVTAFGLDPLLRALIDAPFAARVALTVALLAPAGITLGAAMPLGLRRLGALHAEGVPWAWGVNAIFSVAGSVLAVSVALLAGFTAATLVALACYLVALVWARRAAWPQARA